MNEGNLGMFPSLRPLLDHWKASVTFQRDEGGITCGLGRRGCWLGWANLWGLWDQPGTGEMEVCCGEKEDRDAS